MHHIHYIHHIAQINRTRLQEEIIEFNKELIPRELLTSIHDPLKDLTLGTLESLKPHLCPV
jgi:hypothetical protein